MKPWAHCAIALALVAAAAAAAENPAASSFAWRGTLDTAGHSGLVRVALPPEALARLQSADAADLRVFAADGQPVTFALLPAKAPDAAPRLRTPSVPALPLHAAPAGGTAPAGTLHLHLEENGQRRSLWVDVAPGAAAPAPAGAQRLPAALFDTRQLKDPLAAVVLKASIPANMPVRFSLSTSADLENWTPVAAPGRIFRFDGEGAPANDTLELREPLQLRDRYLRLDWSGQEGVAVESITGVLPAVQPQAEPAVVPLGAPVASSSTTLEWAVPFATPIAGLDLATARENTVVPLRVLGRNAPSEPWRPLAQAVVYRLGAAGQESRNAPLPLAHPSVRWLRLEATHGMRLDGVELTVRARLDPRELVFAAGSAAPYQLAAGLAGTAPAALPAGLLAATSTVRLDALPLVRVTSMQGTQDRPSGWAEQWTARGFDPKTTGLWLVLALGVLVLGGVAWALLHQLRATAPAPGDAIDKG